jgi:anti-sigma factor RsiW
MAPSPPEHLACVDVVEMITDYLEGVLPDAQTQRLERHLEHCPGCSEYVEQMRALAGSLGGLAGDSLPARMRDGLVAAFRGFHAP